MERQYLLSPQAAEQTVECGLLIIGSGIAGMMTAIHASKFCHVVLITKSEIRDSATNYAQGGVAFAIGENDSTSIHLEDTLKAGVDFCDQDMVRLLVEEGAACYRQLLDLGTQFTRSGNGVNLHREGGHSHKRIVHQGDATGAEIVRSLSQSVKNNEKIDVLENTFLIDLLSDETTCTGALIWYQGKVIQLKAQAIILATGGAGQLFSVTTNPAVATGDGIAAAARAGARVTDMEFIQFHPTALYEKNNPRFLISEAVRGEGALLLDLGKKRFMVGKHKLAELAPRDVVVRNMALRMIDTRSDHLYLDLRPIAREKLETEFPTIYENLMKRGYNLHTDLVPITFAAHYTIGGVATDHFGRTTLRNLYACGEVACTGVHGANRLASNSLLEGLVFSRNIADHLEKLSLELSAPKPNLPEVSDPVVLEKAQKELRRVRRSLSAAMIRYAGVFRSEKRLKILTKKMPDLNSRTVGLTEDPHLWELRNLLHLAQMVLDAGLLRLESRGTHQRQEYPDADKKWGKSHIAFEGGMIGIIENRKSGIDW